MAIYVIFFCQQCRWLLSIFFFLVTDSPANTNSQKTNKSNEVDYNQERKSCQNMKSIKSAKTIREDYSDMERNNIYAKTPPKVKSTSHTNSTNYYVSMNLQRRPPVPIRTDSIRSIDGTTVSSFSSKSTTPSNSLRHNSTAIMSRSADASSSSCKLITSTNNLKSKSIYDIETSMSNNQNKCINKSTKGSLRPLQSVKEDECLEADDNSNENYSKVNLFKRNLEYRISS